MDDSLISKAIDYVGNLFAGNSGGHDAGHTMRVYRLSMRIADSEPECNRLVVSLAALLHDADDGKLFSTRDNANARAFLRGKGIDDGIADRICVAINSVAFSRNGTKTPPSIEGKIVQDADRLDAIGAIGIARTFAYGGEHGRSLESTIDHFHEKLLLLKDGMNTETAKRMAEDRHRFMEEFLFWFEKERSEGSE